MVQIPWLDRKFAFDQPLGVFPSIVERLRGTPVRAKQLVGGCSEDLLSTRDAGKWSVKEHLGHLIDLQPLDDQRLEQFLKRVDVLSPADIENRATERADHRHDAMASILERLAAGRERLVRRLEALTEEELAIVALHPRLQKAMRTLDWAYFVAEHDDHHLAVARAEIRNLENRRLPSKP